MIDYASAIKRAEASGFYHFARALRTLWLQEIQRRAAR